MKLLCYNHLGLIEHNEHMEQVGWQSEAIFESGVQAAAKDSRAPSGPVGADTADLTITRKISEANRELIGPNPNTLPLGIILNIP